MQTEPALFTIAAMHLLTLNLALEFSKRVVNAPIFPIERKISDSMRDKIDKYLFRKCNK